MGKWGLLFTAGESANLHNHFRTPGEVSDVHPVKWLFLVNYPSQIKISCVVTGSMVLIVALFLTDLFLVVHSYNGIVNNSYNE